MTDVSSAPLKHVPLMLVGAGLLAVAGLGLFWFASAQSPAPEAGLAVTVDGARCTPMALQVPAGQANFHITNASERPLEWEILDGVMVLAERENIAPGYAADLSTRLKPGVYQITCGLLSNPRGTLTVTPTAQSEAERTAPPLRDFLAPLAERNVYLLRAAGRFERAAQALQGAVVAGDLARAKAAWAEAAAQWAVLALVAPRMADVQTRLAPQAAWLAAREEDAAFIGLPRIEHGLFVRGTTAELAPVADALLADARTLRTRLRALTPDPEAIAADAARYAQRLAEAGAAGGLAPYAGDDRALLSAALESIRHSYTLIASLAQAANPEAAQTAEAALAATEAAVQAGALSRGAAPKAFEALGAALAGLNTHLGLEM